VIRLDDNSRGPLFVWKFDIFNGHLPLRIWALDNLRVASSSTGRGFVSRQVLERTSST
jgi:hypothetical protein